MPFRPFHLGPGAMFKAIGGRHFSFMVFGGAQVLIDIEPLIGILRHQSILHGYTHTIAGALVIGASGAVLPLKRAVRRHLFCRHGAVERWPILIGMT